MEGAQKEFVEQLYKDDFLLLRIYAYNVLGSKPLAEEAVQESFRIACRKIDTVMSSPNPHGWLMNTLKNVLRNMKREKAKMATLVAACTSISEQMVSYEEMDVDLDVLYGDIASSKEFQLIKMLAVDQKSMLEIAKIENISLEACKKRVQRARKKLKKELEKYLK